MILRNELKEIESKTMPDNQNTNERHVNFGDLSYEDAISELKNIIDLSESGEIPLDKIVQNYEEGMKLLVHCQKKLTKAELKIEEREVTPES